MNVTILKIVFLLNLVSSVFAFGVAWIIYSSIDGFEARQAYFISFIGIFLLIVINFFLSFSGLLNTISDIRNNVLARTISFIGLPTIMSIVVLFQLFTFDREKVFSEEMHMIFPSFFYVLAYLVFSRLIKKRLFK